MDGIVLSPVVDQMPHGYHGYWTKDLTKVNPAYGTEACESFNLFKTWSVCPCWSAVFFWSCRFLDGDEADGSFANPSILRLHCLRRKEDVRQLVILLHERRMKVIVDVNMTLGL